MNWHIFFVAAAAVALNSAIDIYTKSPERIDARRRAKLRRGEKAERIGRSAAHWVKKLRASYRRAL